jgi:hypothetical protein
MVVFFISMVDVNVCVECLEERHVSMSLRAWARNNIYAVEFFCLVVSCIGCILFLWDVFSMVVGGVYMGHDRSWWCIFCILGSPRAKVIFGERSSV